MSDLGTLEQVRGLVLESGCLVSRQLCLDWLHGFAWMIYPSGPGFHWGKTLSSWVSEEANSYKVFRISPLYVCIYKCACPWVCVCVWGGGTHAGVCAALRNEPWVSFCRHYPFYLFLRQGCELIWNSPTRLDWVTSKPSGASASPASGFRGLNSVCWGGALTD